MAPPGSAHLNFTLGGVVILGGTMGYLRKGSTMSLMAGLTFGSLLIGSGVLISQGESYKGHALASGVTGIMTVAMGQRFVSTGKFMPAGMVATIGAAGLAYNVKKTLEWMPGKDGTLVTFYLFFFFLVFKKIIASVFCSWFVFCFLFKFFNGIFF